MKKLKEILSTLLSRTSQEEKLCREAQALFEQKDFAEVIAVCSDAISQNPSYLPAYILRGRAKKLRQDDNGAFLDISHALRIDSSCIEALILRAEIRLRLQDPHGAIADYSEVLSLPAINRAEILRARAAVYDHIDEQKKASEDYAEAAKLEQPQ